MLTWPLGLSGNHMLPFYFDEFVFPCCNEILPGVMKKSISVDIFGSMKNRTENYLPARDLAYF